MKITRVYIPEIELSNAMSAIAEKDMTQKRMASFYADCIRSDPTGHDIDWRSLNAAIFERWPKGLQRVKEMAWKVIRKGEP